MIYLLKCKAISESDLVSEGLHLLPVNRKSLRCLYSGTDSGEKTFGLVLRFCT